MNVYFGVCSADHLMLDKTGHVTLQADPVACNIYEPCSIFSPVLKMRYSAALIGYNYFYIPDWNRYYFMETPEVQPGEIAIIRGSEDYLYSNMAEIKALTCNIIRQEFIKSDKYIMDNEVTKSGKSYIKTLEFKSDGNHDANFFNRDVSSSHCYLMTVIGGVNNTAQGGDNQ